MTEPRPRPGDYQNAPSGPPDRTVSHHQHAPLSGQTASRGHHGVDLADLLRRSGTGDGAAFAALYDATSAKVYGVTLRVVRSPEIAAEVLQEVYLMAWQQASRFDPARGTVLGWLCTLAHRRAVDRIRHVARERDREQTFENRRAGTPADVTWQKVEQALDTQEVQAAMDTLTQLQREAVSLAYYQGCTYQEVAQRLDIPLGTAKARIRDGLHRLRTALGVRP
ncbi:ECF RNA polymerase sigma factor SigK [Kocuria sabuli]|uniref:ECF RNA polymerase sigma factor SigK n=1 Tax=Kocuria sabuli TaxID=3071448 RepID=UPI0034D76B8E